MFFLILVLILLIIMLFCLMPSLRSHPDRQLLSGLRIAHRGLHNEQIPENSLDAFAEAAANGYAIENDIHITSDGEIVVFHDNTLERMCGVEGKIEDKTLAELRELRLKDSDQRIPTLKECLDLVDGRVPLLIEFKCPLGGHKRLCEGADKILREYKGKYFIQSFNPQIPTWYRFNRKDILRGQLAMPCKEKNVAKKLVSSFFMNFGARPDFVAYDEREPERFSFRLQKLLGALPVGWTFKTAEDLSKKRNLFKAYIFENFIPDNE